MYTHERNWGCRISDDWTYRGLRAVVMENRWLRITILPDKGTDIVEFLYKPLDLDVMWRSPIGVRNPALHVPTNARREGFFPDYYEGGWQEILPAGGPPGMLGTAEMGQHGEVSLIPWRWAIEQDDPDRVSVRFWVRTYRTPLLIEKRLTLTGAGPFLQIEERLVNESPEALDVMWGHHPCFGPPFLAGGCRLDLPPCRVETTSGIRPTSRLAPYFTGAWPLVPDRKGGTVDLSLAPGPEEHSADLTYCTDLTDGWYALTNPVLGVGFGLRWDPGLFRHLWLWQIYGGATGHPWYSRTYNLAIEPWTSMPASIDGATARGTTLHLAPHATVETTLTAVMYTGLAEVTGITPTGEVLGKPIGGDAR